MKANYLNFNYWGTHRLPILFQTENTECGLACLAMILTYWGKKTDLTSLRRRFSVSLRGVTLRTLMSEAEVMGLHTRALKLDINSLRKLPAPCILHWGMNHFVVLKKVTNKYAYIHDPASGARKLTLDETGRYFTGIALELTPSHQFNKANEEQKISLKSIIGTVVGLKRGVAQLILLGIVFQFCALVAPFFLQWSVDEAIVSADRDLITVLGIGFLFLALVQISIGGMRTWLATTLSSNLNFQWYGNVFTHLLHLPLEYFEKRSLGDLVSRFGSIQIIQKSITTQFVEIVIDGLLVVGTLCIMLLYSLKLTGISCLAICIYMLFRWANFQALRNATAEQIVCSARQYTYFFESIKGIQTIRLFNRSIERKVSWMNMLAEQFNADLKVSRITIANQVATSLIFTVERIVIIWIATIFVIDSVLSVGMLFAFLSYKEQFSQRLSTLIDKTFDLKMLGLHVIRLSDITQTNAENIFNVSKQSSLCSLDIELKGVSFRYSHSEPYIIKNINLFIPEGEFVAITGKSGCGKTTLIKLLLGLLEPTEGEVIIGGIPLRSIELSQFRQQIGTVMQEDRLFVGSVRDNISFFESTPDLEKIEICATAAAIHNDVMRMPMKYDTLVSESGAGFSGGQKQRLLLARALYRSPKILVLDEATSHLDIHNEALVNASVNDTNMTRIIVAHRPETINAAQRIIEIEFGKILTDRLN